jgi:translation initiation factor IF-2
MEDFNAKGECYVIESNYDQDTTQTTATVLVKRGTVKVDHYFACGSQFSKVRYLINDKG